MKIHLLARRIRPLQRETGSALLLGVIISMFISVLVVGFLANALRTERFTEQQVAESRLEYAADNAVALALNDVWGDFQVAYADRRRAHWDFKQFLQDRGVTDQSGNATPAVTNWVPQLNLDVNDAGESELSGLRVAELEVWREDTDNSVRLNVRARTTATSDPLNPRTLEHSVHKVFHIESEPWDGLDYALLANNINCLMCHTDVDNARRFYNSDPLAYGTFERVKVGSLESLQFRDSPESSIAGSLYLAGSALDEHGQEFADWATLDLHSSSYDTNGNLLEDTWGALTATTMTPADADNPAPLENLYVGYSSDPDDQVDGYLPTEFPSPFPDDGGYDVALGTPIEADAGNRIVDDSEFDAVADHATGGISGGVIGVADPGDVIDSDAAFASLTAGGAGSLASVTEGNVYLHGTAENPIVLDGTVAIQGDLILSGYVVGEGSLQVSGNVFIPSDIQYVDNVSVGGDRDFGIAPDGSQNSLAIASGGNVSIGDIFRPEWGEGDPITGNTDGEFNFIIDELANFNRMEWLKTQPSLPGKTVTTVIGTETVTVQKWNWEQVEYEAVVPVYEYVGEYKFQTGTKTVTKTKWVKVGEPWEEEVEKDIKESSTPIYPNPDYKGADYVARYYAFTEDSVVPIFNKQGYFDPTTNAWIGDDRAGDWNGSKLTYADPNDASDPILNPIGSPTPIVSTLTATGGWMSDDILQGMLNSSTAARDGSTFQIDATIYSNNSVFGMMPGRNAPGLNGELLVNGSIVASDVGLLAPNGLQLNYDDRARNSLDLTADTEVSVRRQFVVPSQ